MNFIGELGNDNFRMGTLIDHAFRRDEVKGSRRETIDKLLREVLKEGSWVHDVDSVMFLSDKGHAHRTGQPYEIQRGSPEEQALTGRVGALQQKVEQLTEELRAARRRCQEQAARLEDLKDHEATIGKQAGLIASRDRTVNRLRGQLDEAKAKRPSTSGAGPQDVSAELARLREQVEALKRQVGDLQARPTQEQVDGLTADLAARDQKLSTQASTLATRGRRIEALETELAELQAAATTTPATYVDALVQQHAPGIIARAEGALGELRQLLGGDAPSEPVVTELKPAPKPKPAKSKKPKKKRRAKVTALAPAVMLAQARGIVEGLESGTLDPAKNGAIRAEILQGFSGSQDRHVEVLAAMLLASNGDMAATVELRDLHDQLVSLPSIDDRERWPDLGSKTWGLRYARCLGAVVRRCPWFGRDDDGSFRLVPEQLAA